MTSQIYRNYQEALSYGFTVIPLEGGKCPSQNYMKTSREDLITIIDSKFKNKDRFNIGILTGEKSGVIVIDVDVSRDLDGKDEWQRLMDDMNDGNDIDTKCINTPSRGRHYYFKMTDDLADVINGTDILKDKGYHLIDLKTNGGLVVFAGSVYPGCSGKWEDDGKKEHKCGNDKDTCRFKGKLYEWEDENAEILEMPDFLKKLLPRKGEVKVKSVSSPIVISSSSERSQSNGTTIPYESNKEAFKMLFDGFNTNRFTNYDCWLRFVFFCVNSSVDNDVIHFYSQKAHNYNYDAVEKVIKNYDFNHSNPVKIGTMIKWFKEDTKLSFGALASNLVEDMVMEKITQLISELSFDKQEFLLFENDKGLASVFYEIYGKLNVKTIDKDGNGYVFNESNCLWESRESIHIKNLIMDTMDEFIKTKKKVVFEMVETELMQDEDKTKIKNILDVKNKAYKKLLRFIQSSRNMTGILNKLTSMVEDLGFETIKNQTPHLLPLKNKKNMNLLLLKEEPRKREDNFTIELNVEFEEWRESEADFENVKRFIYGISNNDCELAEYIRKLCGYCLTGETSERSLYILYGEGRNGKTTLMNILKRILSDDKNQSKYYMVCSEDVMMRQERKGGATPELVDLQSARLAVLSETGKQERLNEPRIKTLTGGETITARALYSKPIAFHPKAKYVMMTNNLPEFNIRDKAMTDRLKQIPFLNRFEKNQAYEDSLLNEHLNEIFTYFCIGAYDWYHRDLVNEKTMKPCMVMLNATDEWISSLDEIRDWIAECVTEFTEGCDKSEYITKNRDLYQSYAEYCKKNNIATIKGVKEFGVVVKNRFSNRMSNGVVFDTIKLN